MTEISNYEGLRFFLNKVFKTNKHRDDFVVAMICINRRLSARPND